MTLARRKPSPLGQIWIVFRNDLRLEQHSGEVTITSAFFALLVVVLTSMAFQGTREAARNILAGVLWIATAFALVLSLGRNFAREREGGALQGVTLLPVSPSAIFAGKALSTWVFLMAIQAIVFPFSALFFSVDLLKHGALLFAVSLVATPGIAAAGTLFGVMTVRTKVRDLALGMVLFPLLAPALLVSIAACRAVLDGAELTELSGFFRLLLAFDLVFWAGGLGLFGLLLED